MADVTWQKPPSNPIEDNEQAGDLNPSRKQRRKPVLADQDTAVIVQSRVSPIDTPVRSLRAAILYRRWSEIKQRQTVLPTIVRL